MSQLSTRPTQALDEEEEDSSGTPKERCSICLVAYRETDTLKYVFARVVPYMIMPCLYPKHLFVHNKSERTHLAVHDDDTEHSGESWDRTRIYSGKKERIRSLLWASSIFCRGQ